MNNGRIHMNNSNRTRNALGIQNKPFVIIWLFRLKGLERKKKGEIIWVITFFLFQHVEWSQVQCAIVKLQGKQDSACPAGILG